MDLIWLLVKLTYICSCEGGEITNGDLTILRAIIAPLKSL